MTYLTLRCYTYIRSDYLSRWKQIVFLKIQSKSDSNLNGLKFINERTDIFEGVIHGNGLTFCDLASCSYVGSFDWNIIHEVSGNR